MLGLTRIFLGHFEFMELNGLVRMEVNDESVCFFNDAKSDKPFYRREHVLLVQVEGVFGMSVQPFTAEQRRWDGKRALETLGRGKRQARCIRMEVEEAGLEERLFTSEGVFKGSSAISVSKPKASVKLHPFDAENRLILG